jgi:hypothetical protein
MFYFAGAGPNAAPNLNDIKKSIFLISFLIKYIEINSFNVTCKYNRSIVVNSI